jgi:hypothetical protein
MAEQPGVQGLHAAEVRNLDEFRMPRLRVHKATPQDQATIVLAGPETIALLHYPGCRRQTEGGPPPVQARNAARQTGRSRPRWRCINIRLTAALSGHGRDCQRCGELLMAAGRALQTASTVGVFGGRYELLLRRYHEDGAAGVDLPCGVAVVSGIVTNTRPMAKIPRWGK